MDTDSEVEPRPAPLQRDEPPSEWGLSWKRLAVLGLAAAAAVALYVVLREYLSLRALANREAALTAHAEEHALLVVAVAFAAYVVLVGLALPVGAVLTLSIAWMFKLIFGPWVGFAVAVVVVSFASTAGSTLAFLLSRYVLRDFVQNRFGDRLRRINDALRREGAFYLFVLRLIVVFPNYLVNLLMGPTPIRVWTFWWVSQVGMLPATCVYVYAGTAVPSLSELAGKGAHSVLTPRIIVAFVLIGVFPFAVRMALNALRRKSTADRAKASGGR